MIFDEIVNAYIREHRNNALAEMERFRMEKSSTEAIRNAALCKNEKNKRHQHQYRIPKAALEQSETRLQATRRDLAKASDFASLHTLINDQIGGIRRIGDLTVYDIAHRIGAHFGIEPTQVYLHRGTKVGARALGISGASFDPKILPKAFARLSPAEIEDCLCIYKDDLLNRRLSKNDQDSGCGRNPKRRPC